jgi:hypothetical protein
VSIVSARFRAILKTTLFLTVAGVAVGVALSVALPESASEEAEANAPVPAMQGMSAMNRAETLVSNLPTLVDRLPGDMSAKPGTVRQLFSSSTSNFTLYAWQAEKGDGVCYVSTRAGGGCFARFLGPFNVSVTDFDRLGSGEPVIVSGPVRDDVVGVDVVADGKSYAATVENNVAFFQLPEASLLPSAVSRVTVRLSNGKTEDVRL